MITKKQAKTVRAVEAQHECFKRDMKDIMEEVSRTVAPEKFSEWRLEFTWRLRDFKNHLLKHFDLEEEGGFMADVLREKPEAKARVKKLEVEHEDIQTELDGILAELKTVEAKDKKQLEGIRARVTQLVGNLRAHEAAESELIQEVYYQEYGYPAS